MIDKMFAKEFYLSFLLQNEHKYYWKSTDSLILLKKRDCDKCNSVMEEKGKRYKKVNFDRFLGAH